MTLKANKLSVLTNQQQIFHFKLCSQDIYFS